MYNQGTLTNFNNNCIVIDDAGFQLAYSDYKLPLNTAVRK
jgi:hypothetical protein